MSRYWFTGVLLSAAVAVTGCGGGKEQSAESQRKPLATAPSGASYNKDDLYRFFVVAFGAAPGVTYMGQAVAAADGGASIRQIVNTFTTKSQFLDTYPASLSNLAFAQKLTENIVGTSATAVAKDEAVKDIVDALKLPGMTRGDIVYVIFNNLANKPASDPTWGRTSLKLANQVEYARFYTEVLMEDTTQLSTLRLMVANVNESTPKPDATSAKTSTTWALTKLTSAGSIESGAVGCGSFDIVAKGDLNNDGHDDIVLGPKAWYSPSTGCTDPGFTKLIIAYYDPATKTFKPNSATQAVMPEMQWPNAATIGDFNNDGYPDLFAAGTGTDVGQPCGEAPILLLGSSKGLVDMSHLLPRLAFYSHQAAWGDFNGDGKTDFIILNNNWVPTTSTDPRAPDCAYRRFPGSNESFVILSSGDTWTASALRVSDKSGKLLIDGNQSFNSVTAGDVNNDGKTDLIVIGSNWGSLSQQTLTLINDGTGKFTAQSIFSETPYGADSVGVLASLKQLDSTGAPELVINYTQHPGGQAMPFQKSIYRVFSFNTKDETWRNVTDQYLTNRSPIETDLTYCSRLYWVDINSDGRDDFVCTTINPFLLNSPYSISPRIWLRTVEGRFEPAFHEGFNIANALASPTPVKVDGKIKIVGMRTNSYRGQIALEIAE